MAKVRLSTVLPVPARTVWDTIGGFNSLAKWHPAVARSDESRRGTAAVRRLTLHGGGSIVERLEGKDDKKRTYSYSILEGPLQSRATRPRSRWRRTRTARAAPWNGRARSSPPARRSPRRSRSSAASTKRGSTTSARCFGQ